MVIKWYDEARKAAIRADAVCVKSVISLMESDEVRIEDMDEWCNQAREDCPCLFRARVMKAWEESIGQAKNQRKPRT